jgi:hypothetical protein
MYRHFGGTCCLDLQGKTVTCASRFLIHSLWYTDVIRPRKCKIFTLMFQFNYSVFNKFRTIKCSSSGKTYTCSFMILWYLCLILWEIKHILISTRLLIRMYEKIPQNWMYKSSWGWTLGFSKHVEDNHRHLAVCLTTGPTHLPKRALQTVRSRASSFSSEYPLLSLRSSSNFLRFFLVFL